MTPDDYRTLFELLTRWSQDISIQTGERIHVYELRRCLAVRLLEEWAR